MDSISLLQMKSNLFTQLEVRTQCVIEMYEIALYF